MAALPHRTRRHAHRPPTRRWAGAFAHWLLRRLAHLAPQP